MKDNKLEVGDVLYEYRRWGGLAKHTIVRLTPTTAVTESGRKYKIEVKEDYGFDRKNKYFVAKIIGEYGNDKLETEELKEGYRILELRAKASFLLSKVRVDIMSNEEIVKFIDFCKSLNQSNLPS